MSDLILTYGATGEQGRPVAQELLRRGERVRVMVRHPEAAADVQAQGAEVLAGDLMNPEDVRRATEGAAKVFLMLPLGGNPMQAAQHALDAARAAGVRRLVVNTSGQTPKEPTGVGMMDYRIGLEAMVRDAGISHVILRPTSYMQNLLGPWARPSITGRGVLAYPTPAGHRVSWLAAEDLGPLAAEALVRGDLGGALDIGGPEALTGPEMATAMTRALGREIRYEEITPEAFGAMMGQAFGPEMGQEATRAYRMTWEGAPDALAINMAGVLAQLPVSLTRFEDWLRAHAAAFAPEASPAGHA